MAGIDDILAGGPASVYNPELGMLAIRNPEALAALFASQGHPPPPDASPGITHQDAAEGLGAALNPKGTVGDTGGISTPAPSIGSRFRETFPLLFGGDNPSLLGETPSISAASTPPAIPSVSPPTIPPSGPLPYHRSSQDLPIASPTPVNSGGAVPTPTPGAKPGDLSRPEPRLGGGEKESQVHPDKTVDGLAKALMGLQAMKPDVLRPGTPQPYHSYNQISRSNLPQQLMAEILGAAKPTSQFRLGEALRGKAYA